MRVVAASWKRCDVGVADRLMVGTVSGYVVCLKLNGGGCEEVFRMDVPDHVEEGSAGVLYEVVPNVYACVCLHATGVLCVQCTM